MTLKELLSREAKKHDTIHIYYDGIADHINTVDVENIDSLFADANISPLLDKEVKGHVIKQYPVTFTKAISIYL